MPIGDYKRPKITYTDTIQNYDKIKKSLKDYIRADSIDSVPLGTHVKYLTFKNNKQRFCIGGRLYKKHDDYVILSGAKNSRFSVQRYHWKENADKKKDDPIFITIFWKSKFDCNSVNVKKLKDKIEELETENLKMKQLLITLNKEHKNNINIRKENIILKKQLYQIQQDHPDMFD